MSLTVSYTPVASGSAIDITSYLQRGQFQLDRSLGGEGARCSFALVGYSGEISKGEILASWSGTPVYRGQVVTRHRQTEGDTSIISPDCVDSVIRLKNRIVVESFQGVAADSIVTQLVEEYAPSGTTPIVQTNTTSLTLPLPYVSLYESLERVAESVGASWSLTPANEIRFFVDYYDGSTVPVFDPSVILGDTFSEDTSFQSFANRVWIIGAKGADENFKTQTFDGSNTIFSLAYEPNYTEIRVNGVLRDSKLKDNVDSSTEFVIDKKARVVEARIALVASDVIEIKYRPTREIIDFFENPGSIAVDGLYETVIRDRKITDKDAARQRGRAAIKRSSTTRPVYAWQTDSLWDVYPGQRCSVVYPQLGVNVKARLLDVGISFQFFGHRWHVVARMKAEGI